MDKEQNIIEIVQRFYSIAKKEYDISKVVLFGSFANHSANLESDIDVAIVFNSEESANRIAISSRLFRIASQVDIRIEPKCFFTNEVSQAEPSSIYSKIVKTGIEIKLN
jgi:predicted nucleotidyltransferase